MLHFDGFTRSCVKYKRTSVGLRCIEFEEGKAAPDCPSKTNPTFKLVEGGRSQNYIRKEKPCKESAEGLGRAASKRRKAAREPLPRAKKQVTIRRKGRKGRKAARKSQARRGR
jgi:hypothetical protein